MLSRLRYWLLHRLGCADVECLRFTRRIASMKTSDEWADEGLSINRVSWFDVLILDARAALTKKSR